MSSKRFGIYWDKAVYETGMCRPSPVKRRGEDGKLYHVVFKHKKDAEKWIEENPCNSKIGRKYIIRKVGKVV